MSIKVRQGCLLDCVPTDSFLWAHVISGLPKSIDWFIGELHSPFLSLYDKGHRGLLSLGTHLIRSPRRDKLIDPLMTKNLALTIFQ